MWTWQALAVIGALAIVAGVWTSQSWRSTVQPTPLLPPYTAPPIAATLPPNTLVERAYGSELTVVLNGPPPNAMFQSNTAIAQDLRRLIFEQVWSRVWQEPRALGYVQVNVGVHRRRASTMMVSDCQPTKPYQLGEVESAGVITTNEFVTRSCLVAKVGRDFISILTVTHGDGHKARAEATIRAIAAHTLPQFTDTPDSPGPYRYELSRPIMLRGELIGLLLLGALSILPTLVPDRTVWSRLRGRVTRTRTNPLHTDVEAARSSLAVQSRGLSALRFAAMIWALRLTEEFSALLSDSFVKATILVGVYALGIIVQRLVISRSLTLHKRSPFQGLGAVGAWLGVGLCTVILSGAAALWSLGTTVGSFGAGNTEVADWQVGRLGLFWQISAALVFLWAMVPLGWGRRLSMLAMRNRKPSGDHSPTLLLRSFGDDGLTLRARRLDRAGLLDHIMMRRKEPFEEIQAFALSKFGPPMTVGEPGQRLPPALGAQRLTFTDETWQSGVDRLAQEATLIAVTLGRSAGLRWEIQHIVRWGLLHKTIFMVPPGGASDREARLRLFADTYSLDWNVLDTSHTGRSVLAICWPLGSSAPLVVVSGAADDLSYDLALQECANHLMRETDPATLTTTGAIAQDRAPAFLPMVDHDAHVVTTNGNTRRAQWPGWSRVWAWNLIINSLAIPIMLPLLNGDPIGSKDKSDAYAVPVGHEATLALGGTAADAWFILDGGVVVHRQADPEEVEVVGTLPQSAEVATMDSGFVYSIGIALKPGQVPTIGAFDTGTGKMAWTTPIREEGRAITVTRTTVFLPQPEAHAILALDRQSGRVIGSTNLPCRPWGLGLVNETLVATCPNEGRAILVDPEDLTITRSTDVPVGAIQVLEWKKAGYVFVPREWRLVSMDDPEDHLWTPMPLAKMASRGDVLVAQGVDRVSIFDRAGLTRRNTMRNLTSVALGEDGTVFYTTDRQVFILKT